MEFFPNSGTAATVGRKSTEKYGRRVPLGNITNANAYSLRSGRKCHKPSPVRPSVHVETSPQFSVVGSSNGVVEGGNYEEVVASRSFLKESDLPFKGCSDVIANKNSTITGTYRKEDRRRKKNPKEVINLGTSCPPAVRIRSFGEIQSNSMMEHEGNDLPEASSIPIFKPKKRKKCKMSAFEHIEDDIKKQRDYFADIDAFELIEEVVSEKEMD